jgi:hypothetical protein
MKLCPDFLEEHGLADNAISWECFIQSGAAQKAWVDIFLGPGGSVSECVRDFEQRVDELRELKRLDDENRRQP